MADVKKIEALLFFLFNVILSVIAHNEDPNNYLAQSAGDSDDDDQQMSHEGPSRRKNQEWQYEGIPIDFSNRRAAVDTTVPEPETTTTPSTLRPTPPLNHKYRRIFDPDEKASIEDFPFMAAVLMNNELWCGAAIIDNDKVLTAAHCLQLQYNNRFFREYVKMLTVRVGSTNATYGGELLRVVEITFHPNYKPSTLEFNAAVLKLHKNLTIGSEAPVQDIAYAKKHYLSTDNNILFLGWGSVLGGGGTGGTVLLQKVELPVYEFGDCQSIYGRELVTHSNFCAGFISKRKNVCNHDAGGPAVIGSQLVGVLSFSAKRCDNLDHPAVFTSVGALAPWLDGLNEPKPKFVKVV
ncbi:hypothetical protein O0L34_g10213 [Tuta absoluta]|nr:hypothetical protein O0L34_g10213 [Tuta absoluta]